MSGKENQNQGSQPAKFTNSSSSNYRTEITLEHKTNGTSNGGPYKSAGARTSYYHSGGRSLTGGGRSYTGSGVPSANSEAAIRRRREKKLLAEQNDTFANYIENVRFLEAQNKRLTEDYTTLTFGLDEDVRSIKDVHKNRLTDAKKRIEEAKRQTEQIEIEIDVLKKEQARFVEDKSIHDKTETKIVATRLDLAAVEAEIARLKRQIEILETTTTARLNNEEDCIEGELKRLNIALKQAKSLYAEYKRQFDEYDKELKNIDGQRKSNEKALIGMEIKMLRGMSPEDCEFFKRELAAEISKIRAEYDVDNENTRTEKESEYWSMVEELQKLSIEELNEQERERIEINNLDAELHALRKEKGELNIQKLLLEAEWTEQKNTIEDHEKLHAEEVQKLKAQQEALERECDALKEQLQSTTADDLNLNGEIGRYSTILKKEESRVIRRQHDIAESRTSRENDADIMTITQKQSSGTQMAQIEHDSSRGDVLIRDHGRYITLVNTDKKTTKKLSEWKLIRTVDNNPTTQIHFQLPKDFQLIPGESVKVWARNQGGKDNPSGKDKELVWNESFGVGSHVKIILTDNEGNERATHSHGSDRKQIGRETDSVTI